MNFQELSEDIISKLSKARSNCKYIQQKELDKAGLLSIINEYHKWGPKWKNAEKIDFILSENKFICRTCKKEPAKPGSNWCSLPCRNKDKELCKQSGPKISAKKEEAYKKRKETVKKKYGVDHISQTQQYKDIVYKKRHGTLVERYGENWNSHLYKIAEKNNGGIHPMQEHCIWKSKAEYEMIEILTSHGIPNIIHGDRNVLYPLEIDIWLPDYNLGIEHNGIYYHSEELCPNNPKNVSKKTKLAKEKNIQLISLWDFEWKSRKNQVMDLILSKVGKIEKIAARKTKFKELDKEDAANFISKNHIQPIQKQNISCAFGLLLKDELISVMSFSKHHRNFDKLVLNRFCSKMGLSILGGASKLLKNSPIDDCISWSDNRFSTGNLYKELGFQLEKELPADYFYINNGETVIRKQSATKAALGARSDQTEYERAKELGLKRVWDAGKIRWSYSSPKLTDDATSFKTSTR